MLILFNITAATVHHNILLYVIFNRTSASRQQIRLSRSVFTIDLESEPLLCSFSWTSSGYLLLSVVFKYTYRSPIASKRLWV